MSVVLDASALLAYVQDEDGAATVESALGNDPLCGAANWSEVAQRIHAAGADWELVRALLLSYGLQVEPVVAADAEWAARRWVRSEGLSLADRLCMALGERLEAPVLTADKAWGTDNRIIQIR